MYLYLLLVRLNGSTNLYFFKIRGKDAAVRVGAEWSEASRSGNRVARAETFAEVTQKEDRHHG